MALIKLVPFEEELKRNPELKEEDVKILREWCEKQLYLPKISDSTLALFLHSNYYHIEQTKIVIDTFYTIRTHIPEFFSNRDLINNNNLKKISQAITIQILDGVTKDGYRIIYGRLIDSDPSHYIYNDAIKYFNMVIDLWLYTRDICQGYMIIFDMKNVGFGHLGRLNPMGLKRFLYYLQEGLPIRLKGFHFINVNPVTDLIMNMMRPFMKKQLLDMFHMHNTMESFSKFIPVEILPNESSGKAGSIHNLHNKQLKEVKDHTAWFQEEEAICRVNESLRLDQAKTTMDLFGVEGSFKKLDID